MMAAPRAAAVQQMSLLEWQPPEAVVAFAAHQVQAPNQAGRLSRAISLALSECGRPRDEVAGEMSRHLGKPVSKAMLDAYASQAREGHVIAADRLWALMHATRDRRLLQMLADPLDWAVVERRHLPLIALAAVREQREALARREDALRRQARMGGLL